MFGGFIYYGIEADLKDCGGGGGGCVVFKCYIRGVKL